MQDWMVWLVSIASAMAIGYATQRGTICTVVAVDRAMRKKDYAQFRASVACTLWVALITIAIAWVAGGVHEADSYAISLPILLGGAVFGVGAAINRGCVFSSITRLGAGDFGFLIGLAATSIGEAIQRIALPIPEPQGVGLIDHLLVPTPLSVAVFAALAIGAVVETVRLVRTRPRRPSAPWDPSAAAAVMGIGAAIVYAMHGPWLFTTIFDRPEGASLLEPTRHDIVMIALFLAMLAGAAAASLRAGTYQARFNPLSAGRNLIGGVLMGIGIGLIPGGNDALVVHSIPALALHAGPAFVVMLAAIALTLLIEGWAKSIAPPKAQPPIA